MTRKKSFTKHSINCGTNGLIWYVNNDMTTSTDKYLIEGFYYITGKIIIKKSRFKILMKF